MSCKNVSALIDFLIHCTEPSIISAGNSSPMVPSALRGFDFGSNTSPLGLVHGSALSGPVEAPGCLSFDKFEQVAGNYPTYDCVSPVHYDMINL